MLILADSHLMGNIFFFSFSQNITDSESVPLVIPCSTTPPLQHGVYTLREVSRLILPKREWARSILASANVFSSGCTTEAGCSYSAEMNRRQAGLRERRGLSPGVPRPSRGRQAWTATSSPCAGNSGCSWEFLISKERIRCRICITINLKCQGKLPILMQGAGNTSSRDMTIPSRRDDNVTLTGLSCSFSQLKVKPRCLHKR